MVRNIIDPSLYCYVAGVSPAPLVFANLHADDDNGDGNDDDDDNDNDDESGRTNNNNMNNNDGENGNNDNNNQEGEGNDVNPSSSSSSPSSSSFYIPSSCIFPTGPSHLSVQASNADFWGRIYERTRYQWLPTYFHISMTGECTIPYYINNLTMSSSSSSSSSSSRTSFHRSSMRSSYNEGTSTMRYGNGELDEYHAWQAKVLQDEQPLYNDLARLFERCVPYMESVYGYAVGARQFLRQDSSVVDADDEDDYYTTDDNDDDDEEEDNKNGHAPSSSSSSSSSKYASSRPLLREIDQSAHLSFRGQWLQVITKIVDYELSSSSGQQDVYYDDHDGWHVDGRPHEEIVLTCMYVLDRDGDDDDDEKDETADDADDDNDEDEKYNITKMRATNDKEQPQDKNQEKKTKKDSRPSSSSSKSSLHGGDLLFKRAFHQDEANYVYSNRDLYHSAAMRNVAESWLMVPLGRVKTLRGRLIVFPNSHVYKLDRMKLVLDEEMKKIKNGIDDNSSKGQKARTTTTTTTKKRTIWKKKCRMVIFHLINPMRRIISTREILPQQNEYQAQLFASGNYGTGNGGSRGSGGGGAAAVAAAAANDGQEQQAHQQQLQQQQQYRQRTMNVPEALDHRLDLIQERKETRSDWNVHEVDIYN